MRLEIEISIVERFATNAKATLAIEADTLPDADVSAIVAQMLASVRAKAAEKKTPEAAV